MHILPGELDFWIEKITGAEPFTFIRLGDGELLCAMGKRGRNRSGHVFTKALAADLRKTLHMPPAPNLFFGIGGRAKRVIGVPAIERLTGGRPYRWIDLEPIYHAVIESDFDRFVAAIKTRKVVLVGPPHFKERFAQAVAPVAAHVVIPNRQCYHAFRQMRAETLAACAQLDRPLVLASCSLASVPLGREIHLHGGPATSFFDAGSIWEPALGTEHSHPRSWYQKIKKKHPAPAMEPAEVAYVKKLLAPGMSCLEWGMGWSTLEFSPLVGRWHSIEHDQAWFDTITQRLGDRSNVTPVLAVCENAQWWRARHRRRKCSYWPSSWADLARTTKTGGYQPLVTAVTAIEQRPFDLILVEGRARPECVKAVYDHRLLKAGGKLLVHDWYNRKPGRTHYNLVLAKYRVVKVVERLAVLEEKPRTPRRRRRAKRRLPRRKPRKKRLRTKRKDAVVVTLHQHHERFGRPCLESLRRHAHPSCELIVYDNSSSPPFQENHRDLADLVRYVYVADQHRHGGLTGTWNAGIVLAAELGCDRVCLLNHDTLVFEDFPNLLAHCDLDDTVFGPVSNRPGHGGGRYQKGRRHPPASRRRLGMRRVPSINGFCMAAHIEAWQGSAYDWSRGLVFRPDIPFGGNETDFLERHRARGGVCAVVRSTYVEHFKNRGWTGSPRLAAAVL